MNTSIHTAVARVALLQTCILLSMPQVGRTQTLAAPGPMTIRSAQQGSSRAVARTTYNDTLKRLFGDLEQARTPGEMRAARNRARQGFAKSVDQDRSYSLPYYNLGVLAEADEDWETAIRYFEQFIALDHASELSAKAQRKLSSLRPLREMDSTPAGRRKRQYEQALSEANTLISLGLMKEAISTEARAARVDDTRWETYALVASALADRQLFADAIVFLQKAIARAPGEVQKRLSVALKLCERKLRH
jgi:tetratricopeptide (TPR) repeat protein